MDSTREHANYIREKDRRFDNSLQTMKVSKRSKLTRRKRPVRNGVLPGLATVNDANFLALDDSVINSSIRGDSR